MANSIGNINSLPVLSEGVSRLPDAGAAKPNETGFDDLLKSALRDATELQKQADRSIETKITGGELTNAELFTDLRKADLALRMLLQIRNKLLESFNEIQQMQF